MTRNGIEYNLKMSPYTYGVKNILFYFSSKLNREKFSERYNEWIENEILKFKRRYSNLALNNDLHEKLFSYFIILLYTKIEKRGFFIRVIDLKTSEMIDITDIEKLGEINERCNN